MELTTMMVGVMIVITGSPDYDPEPQQCPPEL